MDNQLPLPITTTSFEEIVKPWLEIIKFQESGRVYFYAKADLLRRLNQLMQDKKTLEKFLPKYKKIKFKTIDLDIVDELEDIEQILEKESELNRQTAFFVLGADRLLLEKRLDILSLVQQFESENSQWSFLLFFHTDFSHPKFESIWARLAVFSQNTVFYGWHKDEDANQFAKYLEAKFSLQLSNKDRNEIVIKSGGNFWLVKEPIRYFRKNPSAKLEDALDHEEINGKLKIIKNRMFASELKVLEKVVLDQKITNPTELHSLQFLLKSRVLEVKGEDFILRSPLFAKYIRDNLSKQLEVDTSNKLVYKGVRVESNFSKSEAKILKKLLFKKGEVVSRDEVGRVVWEESFDEKYSDWALDQLISRLRKKLKEIGLPASWLKTVRGKGVCLSFGRGMYDK